MKILVVVFLIMLTLKLAGVGILATASWWLIFTPLIILGLIKLFWVVVGIIALWGIFPAFSLWVARSLR